jgi:hypothetical protein
VEAAAKAAAAKAASDQASKAAALSAITTAAKDLLEVAGSSSSARLPTKTSHGKTEPKQAAKATFHLTDSDLNGAGEKVGSRWQYKVRTLVCLAERKHGKAALISLAQREKGSLLQLYGGELRRRFDEASASSSSSSNSSASSSSSSSSNSSSSSTSGSDSIRDEAVRSVLAELKAQKAAALAQLNKAETAIAHAEELLAAAGGAGQEPTTTFSSSPSSSVLSLQTTSATPVATPAKAKGKAPAINKRTSKRAADEEDDDEDDEDEEGNEAPIDLTSSVTRDHGTRKRRKAATVTYKEESDEEDEEEYLANDSASGDESD